MMAEVGKASPETLQWMGEKSTAAFLGSTVGLLGIGLGYPGQPHVVTRYMAAKNTETIEKRTWITLGWGRCVLRWEKPESFSGSFCFLVGAGGEFWSTYFVHSILEKNKPTGSYSRNVDRIYNDSCLESDWVVGHCNLRTGSRFSYRHSVHLFRQQDNF